MFPQLLFHVQVVQGRVPVTFVVVAAAIEAFALNEALGGVARDDAVSCRPSRELPARTAVGVSRFGPRVTGLVLLLTLGLKVTRNMMFGVHDNIPDFTSHLHGLSCTSY